MRGIYLCVRGMAVLTSFSEPPSSLASGSTHTSPGKIHEQRHMHKCSKYQELQKLE